MKLIPAARIARIAWRVLWQKKPDPELWLPKPPVHQVTFRKRGTDEVIIMCPNDTLTLEFDPAKVSETMWFDVKCE